MAKATISKSKKTFTYGNAADIITVTGSSNKIYTKGGKDKITLSKGKSNLIDAGTGNDTIIIGKKAGNDNNIKAGAGNDTITVSGGKQTFDGGAGNDVFTVSAGTQVINGGTGNDTFTVKGGNNHILRGGTGSDKYIINTKMTKSTRLTINQSDYKKKDADTLKLAQVNKKDVTYGLLNGTLTIKHKTTGAAIQVTGWKKNKLSQIIFKNGTVKGSAVKAGATTVTWKAGKKVILDANTVASALQISGHKAGDVVATLNSKGQLVLREKGGDTGTLTIKNWNNNTINQITFKIGNYSRTFTADEFKGRTYILTPLKDNAVYTGGQNKNEEFQVNFSRNTNIVINSPRNENNRDRIAFTNAGGWSNDHENIYRNGNDLIIGNWDSATGQEVPGKITIKDFMRSSVRQIEFSNQTYYLVYGNGTWSGSDTYSDRFMIADWSKTGTDPNVGDWNVTIDGMRSNDWIDLRFLPANSQYYSLNDTVDGKDMVLTHRYSPTPSTETTLGTLRLKNFFNADGTVNTTNGYPTIRINREFYEGYFDANTFDGPVWKRIRGVDAEKNYRRAYLNAGTKNADTVDLATMTKLNNNYVWMYYAGEGNDTVTSHAGDIVYGGSGNDTLKAQGRMSDIFSGAGNDTITVRAADGGNLDRVNVQASGGEDVINAYGSYLYLQGGSGNDKIHLYNGTGAESHNSFASGGRGTDEVWIHGGNNHRVNGGYDNDKLYAESGEGHFLYGGASGDDEIYIRGDVTNSTANGGDGDDKLYVQNGAMNNRLYGGEGNDTLEVVSGEDNRLYGEAGDDVLTITGSGNTVLGDDANRTEIGNDTLTIKGGDRNTLWGCGGDDTLIIVDGHSNTLYGDDGDDTLEIVSGYENQIFGGEGNDIFAFGETYSGFNNYINDYDFDKDYIQVADAASVISEEQIAGTYNWKVTLQGGNSFTVIGAADTGVNYIYKN